MEQWERDLLQRDEFVASLSAQFEEWKRAGSVTANKPQVSEEELSNLMQWLEDEATNKSLGDSSQEDKIATLEDMVRNLTEQLDIATRPPFHQPPPPPPSSTTHYTASSNLSSSATSSSTIPFTIRLEGGRPNDHPIPYLIKQTAYYGQLVPLAALTRSSLQQYLLDPPPALKTEIERQKVVIAQLQDKRNSITSLEDFRYASKRWVDLQCEQVNHHISTRWRELFTKILEWEKLPIHFDAVADWTNRFMARWVGDHHMFEIPEVWEELVAHITEFNLNSLRNSINNNYSTSSQNNFVSRPSDQPAMPMRRKPQRPLHTPYPNASQPFSAGTGRTSSSRCLLCGSSSGFGSQRHAASNCSSPNKTAKGNSTVATYRDGKLESKSHKGKSFCWSYQLGRCRNGSHPGICGNDAATLHACSVCARQGHTAVNCDA